MGNLVLTRKVGESVQLVGPDKVKHLVTVRELRASAWPTAYASINTNGNVQRVYFGESIMFAGGNLTVLKHKQRGQVRLMFEYPQEVSIIRSELIGK